MGSDDLFWKKKESLARKIGTRGTPKPRILIVCEGEKTEPNYFKAFKVTNSTIHGLGCNTDSLVQRAIELQKIAKKNREPYDQVWCVFDRDSFPKQNFNNAIAQAEKSGIQVAYSNEAFELWYLLHFNYYNTGLSRDAYIEKLNKLLGIKYKKNSSTMYDLLLEKQYTAIQNAEKLLAKYTNSNPESDNPSTTVHLLVTELNKWLK